MFSKMLSKYICLEIGFNQVRSISFYTSIRFDTEGDHRGYFSCIYIRGLGFEFNIFDKRHDLDY